MANSAANGYRLSGTDMQPFVGQRVQLTGMMAPSTGSMATGTASTSTPEFRVVSVKPIQGSCQQQ